MPDPRDPKDPQHERLLAIVKKLPGAYDDYPWGSIHCKVDGKIFVGWHRDDDGQVVLGIRVDRDLQPMLVASDPRFTVAKYSGKYGGVDMKIGVAGAINSMPTMSSSSSGRAGTPLIVGSMYVLDYLETGKA